MSDIKTSLDTIDKLLLVAAYESGADARLNNHATSRNPYDEGTPEWHEWMRGYNERVI